MKMVCNVSFLCFLAAIAISTPSTGQLTQITTNSDSDRYAVWSPDGTKIAYARSDPNSSDTNIWVIPPTGGNPTQITTGGYHFRPAWAPDGTHIAFELVSTTFPYETPGIYVVPSTGGATTFLGEGLYPAWSPDGSKIAYMAPADPPNNVDIFVMPATGGTGTPITTDPTFDGFPDWSPDGTKIVFNSERGGGEDKIWVIPSTGGTATQITTGPTLDQHPAWSPDGSRIAFSRGQFGSSIWVVPATGGTAKQITPGTNTDEFPDWSPDGTMIVFNSARSGNEDIWVVDVDQTPSQPTTWGEMKGKFK